ncbi:MAG: GTP pyrophosphokinase family protein [Clostridia bacterium]|nr:GTP pyrophosphokinase family protein [Clostridia bacterium]
MKMLKEVTQSTYFDYYRENLFYIEAVIEKLLERIAEIDARREARGERTLCDSVQYRIKSPDSMMAKLKKRGFETHCNSAMENVYDAAGIRIICPYIDDVYLMAQKLAACSDIEVVEIKDYIKNPKENGYRSYHMILKTPVLWQGETKHVTSEVQIRTMVMNSWACCEHQLKYKKDVSNEESVALLKRCADEMLKIDYSMLRIRGMMEESCKREEFIV